MNKTVLIVGLWVSLFIWMGESGARDIQSEIISLQQEQGRLLKTRRALEAKLGQLGQELRLLDGDLVAARQALAQATEKWKVSLAKVEKLSAQRKVLRDSIAQLQRGMQKQAGMVWQRANRQPSWLDVMAGVAVTEIPHRQYLMRSVLESQERARLQLKASLDDLKAVEQSLRLEYEMLSKLKENKSVMKAEAEQRWNLKQRKMKALESDVASQEKRNQALVHQEKALRQLLEDLKDQLLASDQTAEPISVRQRKGKLPWPLKGQMVVAFGEALQHQKTTSLGVQIEPASQHIQDKQVHAMHAGQVRYADWFGGFGLMMVVEYGQGIMGIYAYNDALHQQVGDWVDAGDVLADAGSTGWVESTRLYFEMRDGGQPVNPKFWCR